MEHLFNNERLYKFQELFLNATEICLAVSYIRDSGVKIIKPLYNKNQSIKILLDTKMNISDKNALRTLFNGGINLKSYQGKENYHPKVFLFRIGCNWKAIIGSMNLTRGGLIENIEYGLFLDNKSIENTKKWFDKLWNNQTIVQEIDIPFIESMPDVNRSLPKKKVITVLKSEISIEDKKNKDIRKFILNWTNDIEKEGQSMRKNGWRFRPSQGDFDEHTLTRLKQILEFTPIILTEEYCTDIFTKYKTFSREQHKTSYKDIFIRNYKNYMEKLGIINYEKKENKITLTLLGKKYIKTDDDQLKIFFNKSINRA